MHEGAVAKAEDELARRFMEEMDSTRRLLKAALRDSWSDVEEALFAYGSTGFDIPPQSDNEFRVDFIVAYAGLAAGNAGLLELDAHHQYVIPPGQFVGFDVKIRLKNTSLRHYSSVVLTNNAPGARGGGTAGFLSAALFGKEVPIGALRW